MSTSDSFSAEQANWDGEQKVHFVRVETNFVCMAAVRAYAINDVEVSMYIKTS
ncbi:MAG TPA: hypothetical protein VGO47_07885 [Chlamydiales bacterium]|jgi:hypothetical protein|nr:hypothetical protein [Chlamydiales bacterium]